MVNRKKKMKRMRWKVEVEVEVTDEWWMRVVVAVLGKVCLVVCVSLS
jgi:hypothetical protein